MFYEGKQNMAGPFIVRYGISLQASAPRSFLGSSQETLSLPLAQQPVERKYCDARLFS
jgi:hypothetical protein